MSSKPYTKFEKINVFFKWFWKASTIDQLDSPYLYNFHQKVVKPTIAVNRLEEIEEIRKSYLKNKSLINIIELGAGSFSDREKKSKSIKNIAETSVSSKQKCRLLYNLCLFYKPHSILELGTSLGISSLYLHASNTNIPIVTIEANSDLCNMVIKNLPVWSKSIQIVNETFKNALDDLRSKQRTFSLVYIDGGHRSDLIFSILDQLEELMRKSTILIFDDIYWSNDMTETWHKICSTGNFNIALDLWYFGILTNDEKIKEELRAKILPVGIRWRVGILRN